MTVPATNPTEPTPETPAPAPAAAAAPAADGGAQKPAGTLLSDPPKPDEGKPAEGEPKPAEPKPAEPVKPEGAPEKYEFTAPEGQEYAADVLESFSAAAKEANLTQEAAQKLLETMAPKLAVRQQEQIQTIHKQWVEASTTDKEFGGEKLQENLAVALKAREQFGTPELRKLLDDTGLGNHPEVIRFMYRAGKAISEDKFVGGRRGEVQSTAAVFYPSMVKK